VSQTVHGVVLSKYQIGKNVERSGRGLLEILFWRFLGGTEENHKRVRIIGVLTEIQTGNTLNTSQNVTV
jgi:hypothetical protein